MIKILKLCYIENNWAYFTTQELDKQWGDDWDDAPYEHNAGEPYTYHEGHDEEPWEIVKIGWDGDFYPPCYNILNSNYSVKSINAGAIAWLTSNLYSKEMPTVIHAGTSLEDFCKMIKSKGGKVYIEDNS